MPQLTKISVSLNLPFGLGGLNGEWEPDENERSAAWEMYVELVTRVTVMPLAPVEGLASEAFASLYSLFDITRGILKAHGPGIAQPRRSDDLSFGILAVVIVNRVLRPLLAKWHPLLQDHESHRPETVSALEWEQQWDRTGEMREALDEVRQTLSAYADLLAEVAQVPNLTALVLPEPS
jgi:hypothetical protein